VQTLLHTVARGRLGAIARLGLPTIRVALRLGALELARAARPGAVGTRGALDRRAGRVALVARTPRADRPGALARRARLLVAGAEPLGRVLATLDRGWTVARHAARILGAREVGARQLTTNRRG
jgi:hypothetical protein